MSITFRIEEEKDYRTVENLIRESFWDVYRPGCQEHYVIHRFRNDPAFVEELDILMEKDGELIGQNMFVEAAIKADDGRDIPILAMGPICIAPSYKRQGYGKMILDYCLDRAAELGYKAVFFEGNIDFYGKSGFITASSYNIRYHDVPEGEDASFFLGKELIPGYLNGVTGEYTPPEGYMVAINEPEEFKKFDKLFPAKEKHSLPGQLFSA